MSKFQKLAMSKSVGKILDSSVSKKMVKVGNTVIKRAKKVKNFTKSLKGGMKKVMKSANPGDLFNKFAKKNK